MNLWTVYGWRMPEHISEHVAGSLAALGIEGIELVVDDSANSVDRLLAHQQDVKATLAQYGLRVPSVASGLFWQYNLAARDEATRRRAVDLAKGVCRVAAPYGARTILVLGGLQEPHTPYALTWNNAVRSLREVGRLAEELGVLVGVENVASNFLNSPREMAGFIEDVGHPNVGAYLDLGNVMYVLKGHPENWCTALAGHIVAVHVKDVDRKTGAIVNCGRGDLPWAEVLPVLRESGYDDYLFVETPPDQGGIEEGLAAASESYTGLKPYIS
ncbi:MAG TPA: sugar phosphate isomerase/epimerase family protein [Anaerolineae bacterium]